MSAVVSGKCPKCDSMVEVRGVNGRAPKEPLCPVCRHPLTKVLEAPDGRTR